MRSGCSLNGTAKGDGVVGAAPLAREARALSDGEYVATSDAGRLRKRLNEIAAIDFFGAHGQQEAEAAISEAERRSHQHPDVSGPGAPDLTPAPSSLGYA